jgi:hypothetical protein
MDAAPSAIKRVARALRNRMIYKFVRVRSVFSINLNNILTNRPVKVDKLLI